MIDVMTSKTVWVFGHQIRIVPVLGKEYLIDVTTPPGVPGPPPHHHEDAAELFYILEGELEVMTKGEWTKVSKGENYTVPPGVLHTFRNESGSEVRFITTYDPHGFERFFTDFGVDADQPGAVEESVSPERIARFFSEGKNYGMIVPKAD